MRQYQQNSLCTITEELTIPTVGIDAGPHRDGQVLVIHDMLGMFERFAPKFIKRYANLPVCVRARTGRRDDALKAVRQYKEEVENGTFPGKEHPF